MELTRSSVFSARNSSAVVAMDSGTTLGGSDVVSADPAAHELHEHGMAAVPGRLPAVSRLLSDWLRYSPETSHMQQSSRRNKPLDGVGLFACSGAANVTAVRCQMEARERSDELRRVNASAKHPPLDGVRR